MRKKTLRVSLLILTISLLNLAWGWAQERVSVVNLVHQSREKVAQNDLDGALSLARQAVKLDSAYADGWKQLGRVQMLRKDYPDALNSLQTALDLKPDDAESSAWVMDLYMGLPPDQAAQLAGRTTNKGIKLMAPALGLLGAGNLSGAEQALKGVPVQADTKRALAQAWTHLGTRWIQNKQNAKAIGAFQEALRLVPDYAPARRELGWAFRRAGKPAQAVETWETGIAQNPQADDWAVWIAEARQAAKQPLASSPAVQQLLKSEPTHDQGRIMKLAILLQQNPTEAATYERQLTQRPNGARLTGMGHVYADRFAHRYAAAAGRLEELRRGQPDDPQIHHLLVETYTLWSDSLPLEQKRGPLEKLVALEPGRSGAWRDIGYSLWASKQHEAAIQAWNRALATGPRQALVEQVMALLADSGDVDQAMQLFHRWEPGGSLSVAGIHMMQKDYINQATPFLEAAWKAGEDPPRTGLYLAYDMTRKKYCINLSPYLAPFMARGVEQASTEEVQILLQVLKACYDDPQVLKYIKQTQTQLASRPALQKGALEITQSAAGWRQSVGYTEEALTLYRSILQQDPDRPGIWLQAAETAQKLGKQAEAREILTSTLNRAQSPAVKEGIRGKLAQDQGDYAGAVTHYRQSLVSDPQQPDVRLSLIISLVALNRFDEARQEGAWFSAQVARGEPRDKIYLALARNALGDQAGALNLWREINLADPNNPFYATETARTLFDLCRAKEAVEVLEPVVKYSPTDVRPYELLAEINLALNQPREVLQWTEKGLAVKQTRSLLEMRMEAAVNLNEYAIALDAGQAMLNMDRGNTRAARTVGLSLQSLGRTEEARKFYEDLLKRNPEFLPSQVALKNIAVAQGHPKDGVTYAKETVAQRPWDADAVRRLGVAQAEAQQFAPALKTLRKLASQSPNKIAVLVYSEVTPCAYPGLNSTRQVSEHLGRLAAEGCQFVVPPDLDNPGNQKQVMVIIVDTNRFALREIDAALRRTGGKAVCALKPAVLQGKVPNPKTAELLKELQASGRWLLASSGPEQTNLPVDGSNTLGNPLTHRLKTPAGEESPTAMGNRVQKTLGEAARPLPAGPSRTLVYPRGDYGQYSLDTDRETLGTLKGAVKGSFGAAVASDETGYISGGYDPVRLPGRSVPGPWDEVELIKHVNQDNPYVSSRLDLAKVLSWQSQYEEANRWFRQAAALGGDPAELNYFWGANAYYEGDLPTALEKLRRARELDPTNDKYRAMLAKAELAKRPLLEGYFGAWRDSDQRSRLSFGGDASAYVDDRLRVEAFSDYNIWAHKGLGSESGTRFGGGLQWHFAEECWLRGRIWGTTFDSIAGQVDYDATVHVPNPWLSGNVEVYSVRDQIDTVEAVRRRILEYDSGFRTSTRFFDSWDVLTDLYYTHRTDDNNSPWANIWLIKRLYEKPFYGIGTFIQLATSTRDAERLYWSPQSLQKYMLYLATRGDLFNSQWLGYSLTLRVGPAKEAGSDWRIVWAARASLEARLTPKFSLAAIGERLQEPTYRLNTIWGAIRYRF